MGDIVLHGRQILLETSVGFVVGFALRGVFCGFVHFCLHDTNPRQVILTNDDG